MKHKNPISRYMPILLVIIIVLVTIWAIIAIGGQLLGGGQKPESARPVVDKTTEYRQALLSSDINRAVRLTVRGPIVANEKFRSYQITITPQTRQITTYEGYLEKQLESKQFENNLTAYEELVHALDKRKMMNGKELDQQQNDLRGVCASKKIYEFEILMNNETVKKYWTSDCKGAVGSSLANVADVIDMLLNQIVGGRAMVRALGLSYNSSSGIGF